ncbi:zinc finger and BTB domain-containing protein 17 isoform X1 [Microplitis demolitor]|uniref:zinc finger and BTB domain-containing protein 17 isoform X1 n=1 Tax=Microplitis demolitor TaxID=69319 RepID=UPI0004CDCB10|nr:zinc finger and BTB domain-containing protein 17 isoform X1 [Microplitis demolitor]XP_014299038.1 zinc finger and BTB domain-containing protein 17 isoform X1 [Microplitis demolitor]
MGDKSGKSTAMEVEELKAILESKGGNVMEEEIIYASVEGEDTEAAEEVQGDEIVEIIEEIEVVEGEEEEESPKAVSVTESINDESSQSQDKVEQITDKRSSDDDHQNNYTRQVVNYDADEDWTLEESDPLELKSNNSIQSSKTKSKSESKTITVNGNKVATKKADDVYRNAKSCNSEYGESMNIRSDDDNHHEIVENDLVYTVLGEKKSSDSSKRQEDPRYIKMERLDENIPEEEGAIYYEDSEMGTLYVTSAVNDGEQYQYEEQALEQEDQEQVEQQEQWDESNEMMIEEQGPEESHQDQIYLHEDEDGQLYFKDENGVMQPVYLTEDGNYAIADTSEDQENQELRISQKSDEAVLGVQDLDPNTLRQGSSTSSPTNNDVDNEDNTVTISLIISEDENGLKRTQVIIPTADALKCEICQKSFKTQFQLLRHNRLKHAREEDITTRNFPCDLCPKRFPDQNSLAKHRKTHTGDRPFQCLECQETFPTAPALRRHMSSHNPESKPLPCIYCGRRFLDKPALQVHEASHLAAEQQRGHTCDICNKSFMTPTDLMVHKKNHDPDKKFDCEVCGREFNRLNNLQRHMMVHQQVREKAAQGQSQEILSCDVCGITYKFMSSLTRHMVTSHMNPEKLRQQAEEQRRKRENNYKRYLENRKMYETQHGTGYGKRSYRSAISSDPDDDFA